MKLTSTKVRVVAHVTGRSHSDGASFTEWYVFSSRRVAIQLCESEVEEEECIESFTYAHGKVVGLDIAIDNSTRMDEVNPLQLKHDWLIDVATGCEYSLPSRFPT